MRLGLKPVVVCHHELSPGLEPVICFCFVDWLPRTGDRLALSDGTDCEVSQVWHRVLEYPQQDFDTTVTWVMVRRLAGRAGGAG
jgi:hypothetical protein